MKKPLLFGILALLGGPLLAADSSPTNDVIAAANALADKPNYSWHTTVTVPEGSRFRPGPTDGQTEKDGFTHVSVTFGDRTTEFVLKGGKAAVRPPDEDWQSLSDLDDQGPGRFLGMMIRNFKTPAAQAVELAAAAPNLKKDGDVYSGDLTEAGAKSLLTFDRRGGNGPEISNAKGSVKFWLADGVLTKYEFKVSGTVDFNGNSRDIDRTTTVEIKDVGKTTVTVPDDAKQKLS